MSVCVKLSNINYYIFLIYLFSQPIITLKFAHGLWQLYRTGSIVRARNDIGKRSFSCAAPATWNSLASCCHQLWHSLCV